MRETPQRHSPDVTGENVTVLEKKMTDQWGNLGDENKVERKS